MPRAGRAVSPSAKARNTNSKAREDTPNPGSKKTPLKNGLKKRSIMRAEKPSSRSKANASRSGRE
jgi:hypothetical protein